MICAPITCNGTDLAAVCADIRLRGGCIEAMDVIGMAKYRVSYFYRVAEESQSARVRDPDTGHAGPVSVPNFERVSERLLKHDQIESCGRRMLTLAGSSPAALIHLPKPMRSKNVAAGVETRAEKPKSVPDAPACISIEDRMAALQSNLLSSGKIKRSKPKTMPENYRSPYAD